MSHSKSWSIPVDWKTAMNKSGFGLTSVLKIKASSACCVCKEQPLAWASWEGIIQCYGFYGCPRSLDVCPQPLVLSCLARMGAGGRRGIQCPVNWNSDSGFSFLSLEWEAGREGERRSDREKVQDCMG